MLGLRGLCRWCPVNAIKLIGKKTGKVIWDGLSGLAKPYRPENWLGAQTKSKSSGRGSS